MKRTLTTMALVALVATAMVGCRSNKDYAKSENDVRQRQTRLVEVEEPLSGSDYWTNDKYFRGKGTAVSSNLSTAKKMAIQDADENLAGDVMKMVESVTTTYAKNRNIGGVIEDDSKFEVMSRTVVSQQLNSVRTIGEKTFIDEQTGHYHAFVAREMKVDAVYDALRRQLTEDQKLRQDFDEEQYRKTFNEALEQFKREHNR